MAKPSANIRVSRFFWDGDGVEMRVRKATQEAINEALETIAEKTAAQSPVGESGQLKERWKWWPFKKSIGGRVGAWPRKHPTERKGWYSFFVEVGTARMPGQHMLHNAVEEEGPKIRDRIERMLG